MHHLKKHLVKSTQARSLFLVPLFAWLLLPTLLHGQKSFWLNSELGDSVWVEVNGQQFYLNNEPIRIRTQYPKFDTLRFLGAANKMTSKIICNFKPDSAYSIAEACCASVDIIPTSKLKNDSLKIWWDDYETYHPEIVKVIQDKPFISLRLLYETNDTIYGWYADLACFPQFKILSTEKWEYGVPEKCFYWNNMSHFVFFKSPEKYEPNADGVIQDVYPEYAELEILGSIQIRLFDDERFVLVFDERTGKVRLEYE